MTALRFEGAQDYVATPGLIDADRSQAITALLIVGIAVGVPALRRLHTG